MDEKKGCKPCPEGQVRKDGKCVMPEVTFAALIMSLNTSALFYLGEVKDPATGKTGNDRVLVKHTIDTLVMLEKKTRGNLDEDETALLKNVLYDLKMRYVKGAP